MERLEQAVEALYEGCSSRARSQPICAASSTLTSWPAMRRTATRERSSPGAWSPWTTSGGRSWTPTTRAPSTLTCSARSRSRISAESHEVERLLGAADATLAEWHELLDGAIALITDCATIYTAAAKRPRSATLFTSAVFEHIRIANGQVQSFALRSPFDLILAAHVQGLPVDEFEYGGLAELRGCYSNFPEIRRRLAQLRAALPRPAQTRDGHMRMDLASLSP